MANLETTVAGIPFKNPITGASGTFGYGMTYEEFYPVDWLGGFFTKGLSLNPKTGNPPPRIVETPAGMLNAIGLQNIGYEKFSTKKLPKLAGIDTHVMVNFFGNSIGEYAEAAAAFGALPGVAGLEMNISCPNVKEGGIVFGTDPVQTRAVVKACRAAASVPLLVKLSPNVTDITTFAKICEEEGADGLSVINTLLGMAIDIHGRTPILANVTGGLSGPAIKPVALRMVWQCYQAVKIPIFGIGGIMNAVDVIEFIMAGASAIQVGTHNFVDPTIGSRLVDDLDQLLDSMEIANLTDIIGAAHNN